MLRVAYHVLKHRRPNCVPETNYKEMMVWRIAPRWIAMLRKYNLSPRDLAERQKMTSLANANHKSQGSKTPTQQASHRASGSPAPGLGYGMSPSPDHQALNRPNSPGTDSSNCPNRSGCLDPCVVTEQSEIMSLRATDLNEFQPAGNPATRTSRVKGGDAWPFAICSIS